MNPKLIVFPDTMLLVFTVFAIVMDFVTGVIKARMLGEARTSKGFRLTIQKLIQYSEAIVGGFIIINLASITKSAADAKLASLLGDGLVVAIIYIEVTSIFENAYAMNPNSRLAQFIKPLLNLLTFQFKNNPATNADKKEDNGSTGI